MLNKSVEFGDMLTEAIHTIKACEGKSIQLIQDELGDELGRKGGSAVVRWRAGHLPPTVTDVEQISRLVHERTKGRMSREWHERFFTLGRYPAPNVVLDQLFPKAAAQSEPYIENTTTLKEEQRTTARTDTDLSLTPQQKSKRMILPLLLGGLLLVCVVGLLIARGVREPSDSPNITNKELVMPAPPFDLLDVDNLIWPGWCGEQTGGQVVITRKEGDDKLCQGVPPIASSVGDFRVDYEFHGYGGALTAYVGQARIGYWAALSQIHGSIHTSQVMKNVHIDLGEGFYDSEPYQQMSTTDLNTLTIERKGTQIFYIVNGVEIVSFPDELFNGQPINLLVLAGAKSENYADAQFTLHSIHINYQ